MITMIDSYCDGDNDNYTNIGNKKYNKDPGENN